MKTKILMMMVMLGTTALSVAHADMRLKNKMLPTLTGGLVGNGGGTVVCRDANQKIKSVEVLDLYEARTLRNVNLDIAKIPGDWQAKAKAVVARVEAKSELRFQLYSSWLSTFEKEDKILADVQMSTVPDSGYIGVPEGCEFEQAAIQRVPMFSGDARYYINAELWNAMDDTQKAALVLHEIIYREAIGYGQTDSIRSRYMTGLYASADFAAQSLTDYWKVIEQAHYELTDVEAPSTLVKSVSTTFDPTRLWQPGPDSGDIPSITLAGRFLVKIGDCTNGCETYTPTLFWKSYPMDNGNYLLTVPADVEHMTIAGNSVSPDSGYTSVNSGIETTVPEGTIEGLNLSITESKDQTAEIFFTATRENAFQVQENANSVTKPNTTNLNRFLVGAIAFQLDRATDQSWSWTTASATRIYAGAEQLSNANLPNPLALSQDPCIEVSVLYENNNAASVWSLISPEAGCKNATTSNYATAFGVFANGWAGFSLDPQSQAPVEYNPGSPNTFSNSNHNYSMWFSDEAAVSGSTLTCATASGNTSSNCLQPTFDSARNVLSFSTLQEVRVYIMQRAFPSPGTSEVYSQNQANVKAGTAVTLFPSGKVNTFVSADDFKYHQGNQLIDIPVNVTVVLDDNSNFVSYH